MSEAVRVERSGQMRLPPPTPHVLECMAKAGCAVTQSLHEDEKVRTWAKASETCKDEWRSIARAMYGAIAANAGAKIVPIPEKAL